MTIVQLPSGVWQTLDKNNRVVAVSVSRAHAQRALKNSEAGRERWDEEGSSLPLHLQPRWLREYSREWYATRALHASIRMRNPR